MRSSWKVASIDELDRALRQINVLSPRRGEKSRTGLLERRAMAQFLASITDDLTFPLEVKHQDRPDFVVDCAGRTIGIEHTDVVPENVAHAWSLRVQGIGDDVQFLRTASPRELRKSRAQLMQELRENRLPEPWYGNAPERETVAALLIHAQKKVDVAQKQGFERHHRNWLLMVNLWPAPNPDWEEVARDAQEQMVGARVFAVFDRVCVLCSNTLLDLDASDWRILPVIDPGIED